MPQSVVLRDNDDFNPSLTSEPVSTCEGTDKLPMMSRQRRLHFIMSLRLLSNLLSKTNPALNKELKAAFYHCVRRSKEGDPKYRPVSRAILHFIRLRIDKKLWEQCKNYADICIDQQKMQDHEVKLMQDHEVRREHSI
jgi:hypothetical protein